MLARDQEDLPYRSPLTANRPAKPVSANEQEHSTLRIVHRLFADALENLNKNFNAFTVLENEDTDKAARHLLRQVEIKQGVYDLVLPLYEAVDTAITKVDKKYKE